MFSCLLAIDIDVEYTTVEKKEKGIGDDVNLTPGGIKIKGEL